MRAADRGAWTCAVIASAVSPAAVALPAAAQCEVQEFFGTRQQDDSLGRAVAIRGDVAVAGNGLAFNVPGYVEVYRRQGATWVIEATLSSGVVNCMNRFGECATNGSVIAVGDRLECNGAVYVFRHDGTGWPLEAVLTASDGQPGDRFGHSVSMDGDVVLIGAPQIGPDQGGAYVFRHDGATWVEEAKLSDPNGQAEDVFGWAVALSGDVAVIGGHGNNQIVGAAFVFRRVGGVGAGAGAGGMGCAGVPGAVRLVGGGGREYGCDRCAGEHGCGVHVRVRRDVLAAGREADGVDAPGDRAVVRLVHRVGSVCGCDACRSEVRLRRRGGVWGGLPVQSRASLGGGEQVRRIRYRRS
jgi:hypothetical protein